MTLTIGELCAGYGGLGMAVEEVFAARLAWVSEYEAAPSKILAHHWPHVPNLGDMTQIDWAAVKPVDIISGGTPCQDLSHAGKRAGMTEGTRSNLWVQMREAIATIRPRFVVWENVRGAYSAAADSDVEPCPGCVGDGSGVNLRALGRVLGDLSDLGYDAGWHGLTAASVGAPHGRFRVFVLAWDTRSPADAGCVRRGAGRLAEPREAARGRSFGDLAGRGGTPAPDADNSGSQGPQPAGRRDVPDRGATPDPQGVGRHEGRPESERLVGGSDAAVGGASVDWGQYAPAIARWESVLGRSAPAPTELSSRGSQRLSPKFVEFMMGLPAGHVTDVPGISRNDQLKALGNGVVPAQAAAALRHILTAITEQAAA